MEQEAVATTTAAGSGDTFNDIQNYLTDFNKEIQSGGNNQTYNVEGYYQGAPPGYSQFQQQQQTYGTYTTADGGQIAQGEDTKKVVQIQNGEEVSEEGQQVEPPALEKQVASQDGSQVIQVGEGDGSQMVTLQAGDQGQAQIIVPTSQASTADGQVVLNQDNYQTVTIVPSDNQQAGGEVSYVLIVSQPDGEKDAENMDMSVYDFKGEEMTTLTQESDEDVGGATSTPRNKVIRVTPKKMPPASTSALMCNYCNYTSTKRYLLTRHMKSHSDERPHKCSICNRGFKTIASLQNHVNTHTGTRPHKCKDCDAAFTTSGELVRHTRYRHTFEKPHKCTECDYASVELSKLKRHMRSHTGERPYACPHCLYASPDTFKLKRHLRIHTGEKPYECDICHARFTQSNSLKSHKLIHSGNKPIYQCELCPTTCGRKTDLKIHVQKLHTSDAPICCKKCNKLFPDRYTYRLHTKVHDGEKCYKCALCAYAALSPRHLESHILRHTGEKPYQCDECQQCFRQKQLLRRHKNLYHTPDYVPPTPKEKQFQCMECEKAFAHKGNLLRHVQMHDPNNPDYGKDVDESDGENESEEDEEEETVAQIISHDVDGVQQVEIKPIRSESEGYVVIEVPAEAGQVVMENGTPAAQQVPDIPKPPAEAVPANAKVLDPGESFVARGFKARRGRPPKNERGPVAKDSHLSPSVSHLTAAQLVSSVETAEDGTTNQEEMNEMRKGYIQEASVNEAEEAEVSQEPGYHVIEAVDDDEDAEEGGEEEEPEPEPVVTVTPTKKRGRPKRAAVTVTTEASPAKVARTPRSTRGRKKAPQETAEEIEERQREEEKRKNIETSFGFDEILDDEDA